MSTNHLSGNATELATADSDTSADQTASSPGQRLSSERIGRNLSQKEVADKLHITIHYVNAIEHDAYEKLPGAVFAKGYIKSYAELLRLDVQDYLNCFDAFQAQLRSGVEEQEDRKRRATGKRNLNIAFASVFLFVGVFFAVWYINDGGNIQSAEVASAVATVVESDSRSDSSEQISSTEAQPEIEEAMSASNQLAVDGTPASLAVSEAALPEESDVDAFDVGVAEETTLTASDSSEELQQEQTPPQVISTPVALIEQAVTPDESLRVITISEDGEDILRISFSGESWVEVNDGTANQVYRDLLEAGDVLQITGEAPFNILLGDAPFTQLTFNGDEIDVSENIRIDNSARLTVGL